VNCAKVNIAGGSGSTPSDPATPSKPATSAKPPSQSYGAQPKPPQPSSQPQQPDNDDEPAPPAVTPRPSATDRPGSGPATTIYKTVTTTVGAGPAASGTPDEEDEEDEEEPEYTENAANVEQKEDPKPWWHNRPHREVNPNARRYAVEGWNCECVREPSNSRCYCDSADSSASKRSEIEKKALRMHRRTLYKRVDACDWASAPAMEVSYYTKDAKCAANAKANTPESDEFELGWDVSCGVVNGDGEYKIKMMECNMFGGGY
jgi:hypothetical protein